MVCTQHKEEVDEDDENEEDEEGEEVEVDEMDEVDAEDAGHAALRTHAHACARVVAHLIVWLCLLSCILSSTSPPPQPTTLHYHQLNARIIYRSIRNACQKSSLSHSTALC